MKILNALSLVCGILGFPLAAIIWLGGAMKSVPRLTSQELAMCLPLPVVAIVLGVASIRLSRASSPPDTIPGWVFVSVAASILVVVVTVGTYFGM